MFMYPNLRAEMARHGISTKDLAVTLKVCRKSLENKMAVRHKGFTVADAKIIRDTYFPGMTIDYLFEKEIPEVANGEAS